MYNESSSGRMTCTVYHKIPNDATCHGLAALETRCGDFHSVIHEGSQTQATLLLTLTT